MPGLLFNIRGFGLYERCYRLYERCCLGQSSASEAPTAAVEQPAQIRQSKHVTGDRSGRTVLVTRDGLVFFQQLDGNEHSSSGPPHDQLRRLAGIGFQRILAGGAVTDQGVRWMSGTCQLGPTLKRAVNDSIQSEEKKRALRNVEDADLQIANAEIWKVVLEQWGSSSSSCCSAELSREAMNQIRAATDDKHNVVIQTVLEIVERGDNPEQDQLLHFLVILGKASINHTEFNTISAEQRRDLCERALPLAQRKFGETDLQIAALLANLASAHFELGQPAEQQKLLERALRIKEEHYGKDHYEVAITLGNLGNAYGALGQPAEKQKLLERALRIMEEHYGKDHYEVAMTEFNFAIALLDFGQNREAAARLCHVKTVFTAHFGEMHPNTQLCIRALAACDA